MKLEIYLLPMWTSIIKLPACRLALLLFFFATETTFAFNVPAKINKVVRYDSTTIILRKIPVQDLNKLRKDPDYSYTQTGVVPKTAWERFVDWFWEMISKLFDTKSGSITIKIIRYLFIAGIIGLIIYLLLKNNARALFYGKSAVATADFIESITEIQDIDFDKRIADEVNRRDFRKAIRLCFLKSMKELNQQKLINWKQDKTNKDYLGELLNGPYYIQFEELTRLYEHVWYGDFQLDEVFFLNIVQKFNQFKINQRN